jgi:hypothetical protein
MKKSYICFGVIIAVIFMASFMIISDKNASAQICEDGGCEPGSIVTVCLTPPNSSVRQTVSMGVKGALKLYDLNMVDPGPCPEGNAEPSGEVADTDVLCDDSCLESYTSCLEFCDLDASTYETCAADCADINTQCVADSCN